MSCSVTPNLQDPPAGGKLKVEGGNPDIHRGIGNVGGMDREVLGGNADVRIVGWKAKGSRKGDETILMVGGGN